MRRLLTLVLALLWNEDRVRLILITSGVVFLVVAALIYGWATRIKGQLSRQDDLLDTPQPVATRADPKP